MDTALPGNQSHCAARFWRELFEMGLKRISILTLLFIIPLLQAEKTPDVLEMALGNDCTPKFVQTLAQVTAHQYDNARDADGLTMMHLLARRSHQARILIPLLAGADVNARDHRGRTPLFENLEAFDDATKGAADFMILEMLTIRGADVNVRASDGTTPLAIAVAKNDFPKAEFLIWRGAEISPKNVPNDKLPLEIAHKNGDQRMIALLESRPQPKSIPSIPAASTAPAKNDIFDAVSKADFAVLDDLLAKGWNINERDNKGKTALFRAVETNRADAVTYLLLSGASPDIAIENGTTPLMLSMGNLMIEGQRMQVMLILAGADVNLANKTGETPFIRAAAAGHDWGVMFLYAAGADVLAKTPKGAVTDYCFHPPTLWYLKQMGAPDKNPVEPPKVETDPAEIINLAALQGDLKKVEEQLKRGIRVDTENKQGFVPLRSAAWGMHLDVVDYLLKNGAAINYRTKRKGSTILHSLADWGVNTGDDKVAATMIENLLERGIDPNLPMWDGTTPLMRAAKEGTYGANTQALLKGGAKINLRNKKGQTALGVAREFGRTEMVAFLESRGAEY